MDTGLIILIVLVIIVVIIAVYFISLYNKLVGGKNKVENAWSQIEVQLKRRADLIPNLVETVQGYASHESTVFENVTKSRSDLMNADSPAEASEANNKLTSALGSLFAIAEAYPDLKANTNFLSLQDELATCENKIAYARQFYNDTVLMFNNMCLQFPSNLIANMCNFKEKEYFKGGEGIEEVPKVEFWGET